MMADGEDVTMIRHGNTVASSDNVQSEGTIVPVIAENHQYAQLAAVESNVGNAAMTDRSAILDQFTWYDSDRGVKKSYQLPKHFITKFPGVANNVFFQNYAYWNGDMEIEVVVNSTPFQTGQLQVSFYYGNTFEYNYSRRNNVYSKSQQPHCLIMAGKSNSIGKLTIPFRYYKPRMGTSKRPDDPGYLDMGELSILVLNPLTSGSQQYKGVDVTIRLRYTSSNFGGMIDPQLRPQMFNMVRNIVSAANSVLNSVPVDRQRDKPPLPQPPTRVLQNSSTSFCLGTNVVDPLHLLRLDAYGTTPHPLETQSSINEMSVKYLTSVFGLVRQITWPAVTNSKLLFKLNAGPILNKFNYSSQTFDDTVCYNLPPISVMAHCFALWRGSVELRLDVIKNVFHTGRLIIGYVSRVLQEPTFDQLISCPHEVFDLRTEDNQFVFTIPYMADRPWWQTALHGKDVYPPGYIYCFIENGLVANESVANYVTLNLYMRGGPDFELSVPISPTIGLSTFNAFVDFAEEKEAYPELGHNPIYIGGWRNFYGGDKQIFRTSEVSDYVATFINLKAGVVYVQDMNRNGQRELMFHTSYREWYVVGLPQFKSGKYCTYASILYDAVKAQEVANGNTDLIAKYTEPSAAIFFLQGQTQVTYTEKVSLKPHTFKVKSLFKGLTAQMDQRSDCNDTQSSIFPYLTSTKSGMITHGESFDDIKVLMRRYQLYLLIDETITIRNMCHNYCVPLLFQGRYMDNNVIKSSDFVNYNREGLIPIIASAFRFYRGGMRVKFIWKGNSDAIIRLEHRPDERLRDWSMIPPKGHKALYNDGYAQITQCTIANRIIEMEIPFYHSGLQGMLQHPNIRDDLESYHYGLGYLYIGIRNYTGIKSTRAQFDLYYSLADDCRFSVFQGFPPMMLVPDDVGYALQSEYEVLEPQMFAGIKHVISMPGRIYRGIDKAFDILDEIDERKQQLSKLIPGSGLYTQIYDSIIEHIKQFVPDVCKEKMEVISVNIIHVILNPNLKAAAWALASIMLTCGLISSSVMLRFAELLTAMYNKAKVNIFSTNNSETAQTQLNEGSEGVLEPNMECEDISNGLVATLVTSIVTLGGYTLAKGAKCPNFANFQRGLNTSIATVNGLTVFFAQNLTWMHKVYRWVMSKVNPAYSFQDEVESFGEQFLKHMEEAIFLTNADNVERVETDVRYTLRLYEVASIVEQYLIEMVRGDVKVSMSVTSLFQKVLALRDRMMGLMKQPPVRSEPYVVYIVGDQNIGKSYMLDNLIHECLHGINYSSDISPIYTRTQGNPYWNGYRNNPIIVYDDYNTIGGERGLDQISELFSLKSCAIFNPNQARLEDKDRRANPIGVFISSNIAYPKPAGVEHYPALWRRRDIMIKVEKNIAFYKQHGVSVEHGSPNDFQRSDIMNFEHLIFKIFDQVIDDSDLSTSGEYTYLQFKALLKAKFVDYTHMQHQNFRERLRRYMSFMPQSDPDTMLPLYERVRQFDYAKVMTYNAKLNKNLIEHQDFEPMIRKLETESYTDRYVCLVNIVNVWHYERKAELDALCVKYPRFSEWYLSLSFQPKPQDDFLTEIAQEAQMGGAEFENMPFSKDTLSAIKWTAKDAEYQRAMEAGPSGVQRYFEDLFDEGDVYGVVWKKVNDMCKDKNTPHLNDMCAHTKLTVYSSYERSEAAQYGNFHQWNDNGDEIICTDNVCGKVCRWNNMNIRHMDLMVWMSDNSMHCMLLMNGKWKDLPLYAKQARFVFRAAYFGRNCLDKKDRIVKSVQDIITSTKLRARDLVQGIREALEPKFRKYGSFVFSLFKHALMVVPVIAAIYGAYVVMTRNGDENLEVNLVPSGDHTIASRHKTPLIKHKMKGTMIKNLQPQSCNTQLENIVGVLKKNTFFIVGSYNGEAYPARCLGLGGRRGLMPTHYHDHYRNLPKTAIFYIHYRGNVIPIEYDQIKIDPFQDSGLALITLPKHVPIFKNITRQFATQADHPNLGPKSRLIILDKHNDAVIHNFDMKRVYDKIVSKTHDFEEFIITSGYSYPMGGKGLCGAVLISADSPRPIIGFHVAGVGTKYGISEVVNFEDLSLSFDNDEILDVIEPNMAAVNFGAICPNTNVMKLGSVEQEFMHREGEKSRIIPTECHNEIYRTTFDIPILGPNDPRNWQKFSPLREGINKHGILTRDFPANIIQLAYEDLRDKVLAKVKPLRQKIGVLTTKRAVLGIPSISQYERMNFDTSEGFPFSSMRQEGERGKTRFFVGLRVTSEGYDYDDLDETLKEVISIKETQREQGIVPYTVFIDCLKDHKLPKEKILVPGKVRIFSISPIDYTISARQYYLDFVAAYQTTRLDIEHAIGIDVDSDEWTQLANELLSVSDNIITADYSNFGPGLNSTVAGYAMDIINDWYSEYQMDGNIVRENRVRTVLATEVIQSKHLSRSVVYQTMAGMPSGGPMTVIQNSLVNSMYLRCIWLLLHEGPTMQKLLDMEVISIDDVSHLVSKVGSGLTSFTEHVKFFVYGDDVIMSVSDDYKSTFNCRTIAIIFSWYGIEIKNASKSDKITPYTGLSDATFLKRGFLKNPKNNKLYLAPLEIRSIQDTANWTYSTWSNDLRRISLEACDQACRLAYGHGPKYHGEMVTIMVRYWRLRGEHFQTPPWSQLNLKTCVGEQFDRKNLLELFPTEPDG
nr:hypothetical protein [Leuven Picorna-like virus 10]